MAIDPNSIDSQYLNYDFGQAVDASNIDSLTQPAANQNGTTGFNFNDVTKGILNLFDNGLAIYQKVNAVTGGASSRTSEQQKTAGSPQVSAASSPVAFGLNQTQLLWIAGGLGVILVISLTSRKG